MQFCNGNPPQATNGEMDDGTYRLSQNGQPVYSFVGIGSFGEYAVVRRRKLVKLVKEAPRFLRPGGWLGFEVGQGQGALMARHLEKLPAYSAVETCKDSEGTVRALFARSRATAA